MNVAKLLAQELHTAYQFRNEAEKQGACYGIIRCAQVLGIEDEVIAETVALRKRVA